MSVYAVPFDKIATGAVADAYKTMAAYLLADTTGYRARLRGLYVGPAGIPAGDLDFAIKILRVLDISAGGAGTATTIAVGAIPKLDPDSIDSIASGGVNYTVEPTTYETHACHHVAMNARGTYIKEWLPDDEDIIKVTRDMLLGLLIAPRTAAAITLTGSLVFETY